MRTEPCGAYPCTVEQGECNFRCPYEDRTMKIGFPKPPVSMHALSGDPIPPPAKDQRGCVMYFETAEECENFMCFVAMYPLLAPTSSDMGREA